MHEVQMTLLLTSVQAEKLLALLNQIPESEPLTATETVARRRGRPPAAVKEPAPTPEPAPKAAPKAAPPEPAPKAAPKAIPVSRTELVAMLKAASEATSLGSDAVRAIMLKHGAKRLSDLSDEQLPALRAEVEAAVAANAPDESPSDDLFAS